jgi:endonuclease YncB( thermonuclease family)
MARNVIPFERKRRPGRKRKFDWKLLIAVLLTALFAVALMFPLEARVVETVELKEDFVRVVDADTIAIRDFAIRVKGIAAPEEGHPTYGAGKEFLGRLLRKANTITCRLTAERTYERRVGRCSLEMKDGSTVDMQRAIVESGFARGCPRYGGWRYLFSETSVSRRLPFPSYCWGLTFF